MIEHALIGQLKIYPVYMDGRWPLKQGEIQKVTKPGEKQWFLKFRELKLSYQFCKQKDEVTVNIQVYIVVEDVNIVLNFEFRF